ncbi:MAG: hypothetical protein JWQ18_1441, partial [Conexibacter sp.]|nr:hypothetical protein [Conexibacter sp.]
VGFTGTGFGDATVVSVKLDDGLLLPSTGDGAADVLLRTTADGAGAISGTIHLAGVRAADQAAIATGVHRLRFLASSPARSVHADFAVKALTGPPLIPGGATVALAPPADQLLDFPFSGDPDLPYDDLPRLVAGSAIPYRFSGFDANQAMTLKLDDGANVATPTADGSGAGAGYAPADAPVGTHWIRYLSGFPSGTSRSIRAPFEIVPNDGRGVLASTSAVPGGNVAFSTTGLTRSPADYVPSPAVGQTVQARLGSRAPVTLTADATGAATGLVPIPSGLGPGTYDVAFWVGFAVQNDFPQALFVRRVTVAAALPDASATLAAAEAPAGGSVAFALGAFAKDAGGGQKVAVSIDDGAVVQCVDTDVQGAASGTLALPAAVGAHTVRFRAGSACVPGGPVAEAPVREVAQTVTVTAPVVATPLPIVSPAIPPTAVVRRPAIASTALRVSGGKVKVMVRPGSAKVKATIVLRTRDRVKLSPRSSKAKRVTLARRALTLPAGSATRSITLTLTRDGKALLARHRSLAARLQLVPASGATISRTLTLKR